ncbi:MAG: iron-sulfur cluster assembly scaffold protein [Alphaproteobacteria bacterium]|nr:iron-sulfur cluster assembly scaffold protein [Alphaproteobacteria bacterium]NNF25578.1 iron-sulfur cluster assembly scaffold protein [Paracoccaceae bacterium]
MSETDLIKLYSGRILELAADIPHLGRLTAPQASATRRSTQCGSTVTVDLCAEGGTVTAFAQDVHACALGQAAASVVGRAIIGASRAQILTGRDQLAAMLAEDGPPPEAPFDALEVLLPARAFKNRHQSILLSLNASVDALSEIDKSATA